MKSQEMTTKMVWVCRWLVLNSCCLLASATWLKNIPSTGEEWISLPTKVQFQPGVAKDPSRAEALRVAQRRFLGGSSSRSSSSSTEETSTKKKKNMYVDSQETNYEAYSQAWRYLGFYVDCSPYQDEHRDDHRRLREDDKDRNQNACQRYLLWAAYVDLDYEGNGVGEYSFYNTGTGEWNNNACNKRGSSRCVKMDCHMPDTHFELLGFFKEPEYTAWFEQLFKHEGYCIWSYDQFYFMYSNYGSWPERCTQTGVATSDGTYLYYELKPAAYGNMTLGLYTDNRCATEYTGTEYTAEGLLGGKGGGGGERDLRQDGGGLLTGSYQDYWNANMAIYKVCQPCRAYYLGGNNNYNHGRRAGNNNNNDDNYNNDNGGLFECDDYAGYTNVNQCMKFRSHTEMEYAGFEEVMRASQQGSLISLNVGDTTFGYSYVQDAATTVGVKDRHFLWNSLGLFMFGLLFFCLAFLYWGGTRQARMRKAMSESLVSDSFT